MIINAEIVEWAKQYQGELFHAALMDAPYEISFMGKSWDSSGVAFDPETWKAIASCLHDGAMLFVFAGTQNDDMISAAMRQAGLRKFSSMAWSFGSGFPKATRIDTAIDKAAGIAVEKGKAHPAFAPRGVGYRADEFATNGHDDAKKHEATSDLAKAWSGHRYGRQAIKPALESILVFQKPYRGKPVDSIIRTGSGTFNIDGSRVGGVLSAFSGDDNVQEWCECDDE